MPVIIGATTYPEGIVEKLGEHSNLISLDALKLSIEAGSPKAVNVVLIGVLAKTSNIDKEVWLNVIKETVPEKFLELNLKAFELGYNY